MDIQRKKAALLDRDGVFNELVDRGDQFRLSNGEPCRWTAPFRIEEFRLMPGVHEALSIIRQKGYLCIVTTNQPDVATGNMQRKDFDLIMTSFSQLPLDGIYACTHHPKERCPCRKPAPGLLIQAREVHGIDLASSYMIGDMETDMQAGKAAGVRGTVLVRSMATSASASGDFEAQNILAAAHLLP